MSTSPDTTPGAPASTVDGLRGGTPPGLVACALALWGQSTGQLLLGLLLGVTFEAVRHATRSAVVGARWPLRLPVTLPTTLPLTLRACSLVAVALLGYLVLTQSLPQSLYTWLRWLPAVLVAIPVVAALGPGWRHQGRELDTTHAYAAVVLAAAGTGTGAGPWLYAGYAALAGWALLARLPRKRLVPAAAMLVAAVGLGHAVHSGAWWLQGQLEQWSAEMLAGLFSPKPDPFRERTRIGELGRVKLSDRILMRVEFEGPPPAAVLLREVAFDRYANGEWASLRRGARPLQREGARWRLSDGPATHRLTVRRLFSAGEGLLPLPAGTRVIEGLADAELDTPGPGTVRVRQAARPATFTAIHDPGAADSPFDAQSDLLVPPALAEVLERLVATRQLRRGTAAESVAAVRAFFEDGFDYSLDLGEHPRTLRDFLLTDRRGHCEYFASGTVLLLRALGVPARYAAGYAVQEWSELERAFVVRRRHAHAWAQAFVDGRWIEVDTTPARWADAEAEAARGWFAPLADIGSWAIDRAMRGWMAADWRWWGLALAAVVTAAVAGAVAWLLAVRAARRWRRRTHAVMPPSEAAAAAEAAQAAWREVEALLERFGYRRAADQTVREWARRMAGEPAAAAWADGLVELARRYGRVRFDPAVPPAEVAGFIVAAKRWVSASAATGARSNG